MTDLSKTIMFGATVLAPAFSGSSFAFIGGVSLILYGIPGGAIDLGFTRLSALAVASLTGILLNAVLPGKDYEFGK